MQFYWISGINSVIGVKIISVSLRVYVPNSQWCNAKSFNKIIFRKTTVCIRDSLNRKYSFYSNHINVNLSVPDGFRTIFKGLKREPHLQRLNFSNLFTVLFLTKCTQIKVNTQTQKARNYWQKTIPGRSKSFPVALRRKRSASSKHSVTA